MEWMKKTKFEDNEVDDPSEIIEGCVKARRKLISGFGHFRDLNKGRFDESFSRFPSHWAISLSGEPTIYPKLGALVRRLMENPEVKTVFIVTNGQEPERLARLSDEGNLPTQLYLSLSAADPGMFREVNRSVYKDGWERLMRTIGLFPLLKCRRAIRFTLIKGVNDGEDAIPGYAAIIERSKTDFVEIKSYMALGFSRKRLGVKNMLEHDEVMAFARKLVGMMPSYGIADDDEVSRIALLKRKDSAYPNMIPRR
jgi:tRNA wybutosine-synthesizing protein 1